MPHAWGAWCACEVYDNTLPRNENMEMKGRDGSEEKREREREPEREADEEGMGQREREREMGREMEKALMSQDRGLWFKPDKLLRTTNIN